MGKPLQISKSLNGIATRFKKGMPAPPMAFKKGNIPWNKGKKLPEMSGEKHPNWKGRRVKRNCLFCGKPMEIERWRIRIGKGKFCSVKCSRQYRIGKYTGDKASNWKGGRMSSKFTCAYCGESFRSHRQRQKRGGAPKENYYCSRACWYLSDECKEIGRQVSKLRTEVRGKEHPNWRGGKSFEPYTPEFNESLKRKIRKRDNDTCQLCGKGREKEGQEIAIHHIDYDKTNCKENNLICLCRSCNSKVNFDRLDWMEYFRRKL